jgi:hypothetical protein
LLYEYKSTETDRRDGAALYLQRAVMFAQRQLEPFVEANAGYMLDLEHALTVLSVDHQALLVYEALSY